MLIKLAKSSQEERKDSKREIEKKINQIRLLTSKSDVSQPALKEEIKELEKHLKNLISLEKKLKERDKEITVLKKQMNTMKQKLSSGESAALKKKIEKISHFLGDLMAKEAVRKDVHFEKVKRKLEGKISSAPPAAYPITLKKIDQLQEKILVLKKAGKYPPEKIAQLEERLTALEKKLSPETALTSKPVQHRMLFGPRAEKITPAPKPVPVVRFEKETEKLPFVDIPPPPKKKKKEEALS